ncbi:MAG: hypothetical protein AB7N71_11870 [Phycisphaerae bacterium]
MKSMRLFALTALVIAAPALGGLNPGDQWYNPALAGSGEIGDGGPYYTAGSPAWLNGGSLATSLSSPIQSVPGFPAFTGTVNSAVYYVNGADSSAGLGFAYQINLAANSASRLVRASLSSSLWQLVSIIDAGSDQSGNSTAASGNTTWTDGDPYFIEREATMGLPAWNFRFGTDGTRLDAGNVSAWVWFETDARNYANGGTISLLDGGTTGAARVLTVGAIPSPAAAGLSLVGMLIVGVLRRR